VVRGPLLGIRWLKLPKITGSEKTLTLVPCDNVYGATRGCDSTGVYRSLLQDSIKDGLKKRTVSIRKLKDDNLDTKKYFSSIGQHDDKQTRILKAINVCNLLLIGIPNS
jgi:hypothetical protein